MAYISFLVYLAAWLRGEGAGYYTESVTPFLVYLAAWLRGEVAWYYTKSVTPFIHAFAKLQNSDYLFRRVCLSICPSVPPSACLSAWKNSVFTGRIFMKFYIWTFFENLSRWFKFH